MGFDSFVIEILELFLSSCYIGLCIQIINKALQSTRLSFTINRFSRMKHPCVSQKQNADNKVTPKLKQPPI